MRKRLTLWLAAGLLLTACLAAGCSASEGAVEERPAAESAAPAQEENTAAGPEESTAVSPEGSADIAFAGPGYRQISQEETETAEIALHMRIGETEVPVTWEENDSVEALRALLPLEIPMSMYGGFEQVGPIGESLPRHDEQTATEFGDIVLYAGDQIVVFYGSNSWAYTRLGHVDLTQQEMEELLGSEDVTITIMEG